MTFAFVHTLFEAQAAKSPDAVAVALGERHLTFGELNSRANRLAHRLRRHGVGPDVLVGVLARPSPEMVCGLIAVLKAGGAYVPLDVECPAARQAFVLVNIRAPVLLTERSRLGQLPEHEAEVICLDELNQGTHGDSDENPRNRSLPDSLAYTIYTSGSTGEPKGVLVTHRGLSSYLTWCVEAYGANGGRGAPVQSSVAFDLTVTSLFAPLLAGRTVFLPPEGAHAVDWLRSLFRSAADFSLIKITPAHLELLGRQITPREAAGRARVFVVGGENLTAKHVAFWQEFAAGTTIVNEYGPTETAVGCCVYRLRSGERREGSIPIGRPVAGARLYVLGPSLRPVPRGSAGELFIGGPGVARGYHGRPDLTAERFLPDPFCGIPGARMYRTGDLVRALPGGDLEFLGRIGDQVKVRGYRVELEEIEAEIARHPAVAQAVVLAREDVPGERQLVAYVVARPDQKLGAAEMQDYLRKRLPDYMVPPALVEVAELPTTLNGKVDRRALPPPGREHLALAEGPVAPRDELEARMARLWEEVLRFRPVGVRDDFFGLGGDSLLAIRLVARVHDVFGQDVPLARLLEAPTVERFVKLLDPAAVPRAESSVVAVQPLGSRPPFFCVHAIGGEVLTFAHLAHCLGQDQPFYGIQALPAGGPPAASLEELAARYVDEVLATQREGPYHLGGYSFGATVAFEMARQLRARGESVGLVAILDQWAGFAPSGTHFRPAFLLESLKNLPFWIWYDLLPSGPRALLKRLRLKARADAARAARLFSRPRAPVEGDGVGAVFDLDRLPGPYADLLRHHFHLLLQYEPGPYAGRVTVFRARAQPLLRFQAHDLGWGRLAQGGSEVVIIPGTHDNLVQEPHVRLLARELRQRIDTAPCRSAAPVSSVSARPSSAEGQQPRAEPEEICVWRVVVNEEGQYSVWPMVQPNAPGWEDAGPVGSLAECLAYVQMVWSDLRPASLREAMRPARTPPQSRVSVPPR